MASTLVDSDVHEQPASSQSSLRTSGFALEAGARVGRYAVLDRVGTGAVGVVYAAYDPELDRRVALKFLLPGHSDALDSSSLRGRLLREAQALARLSHPNVVAVHDVGTYERRVYVAMEFVEGATVRQWLSERTRSRDEILSVFIQAGRGLQAAHAAGLVHRDFKPENVILAEDGRVKVLDFGLARATDSTRPDSSLDGPLRSSDLVASPGLSLDLTRTGGVLGTPAYMSPEQHMGLGVTPKSDQFCFCVALYEALHGERPYPGDTLPELALSVTEGRIRTPSARGDDVPPWLRRVLLRGLQVDPDERFPDMHALLLALTHNPVDRAKRLALLGVGGVVLATTLGIVALRGGTPPPCSEGEGRMAEVWNAERGQDLDQAFARVGVPYADHAAATVRSELDAWATAWSRGHREACEATRVRAVQSEELLDRRMHCLERGRATVGALVSRLVEADALVVERAVDAVAGLPDLRACEDVPRLLAGRPPLEGEAARRAEALEAVLDELTAAVDLEEHRDALERMSALEQTVFELDDPPTSFRFFRLLARLHDGLGHAEQEQEHWLAAFLAADRGADDWGRFEAALRLASVTGYELADRDAAARWIAQAEAVLRRIDEPPILRAQLDVTRGAVALGAGNYEEALGLLRGALQQLEAQGADTEGRDLAIQRMAIALRERGEFDEATSLLQRFHENVMDRHGPAHPVTATSLGALANDAFVRGDYARAAELWGQGLAIVERVYGRESPRYMDGLNNHAAALHGLGRDEEAEREHREILAFLEARYGEEDVRLTPSLENLGNVLIGQARFEEARAILSRSLAIKRQVRGADHPSTAMSEMNLGVALHHLGKHDEAEQLYQHTLAVWSDKLGSEHPDLGLVFSNLGDVAAARGRYAEAAEHQERALALLEPQLGSESADLAFPLTGLGIARLELGDVQGAREALERARALREGVDLPRGEGARMRFAWARVIVGEEPEQARDAAQEALREAEQIDEALAQPIRRWLESVR